MEKGPSRHWMILLLAGVLWIQGVAGAQTASPSRVEKRKAKRAFRLGKKLFRRHRYTQAVEAFENAYRFWPRREIQFNIAYSYAKLGEWVKAVTHLRLFLKKASTAEKKRLPRLLRAAQGKVGVLVVRMPDDRAEIFVDGRPAGRGQVELVVEPGQKAVEIRLNDRTVSRKNIDVLAGTEKVWELTEMPQSAHPTRPVVRQVTRASSSQVEPRTDDVVPSKLARKGIHWAYFAAASVLAVGAGAAVVAFGLKTQSLRKDYEDHPSESLMNDGNRAKLLTNVMIGVTAGAAATAAVLAIFTRWGKKKTSERQTRVSPAFIPGGGMLVVTFQR